MFAVDPVFVLVTWVLLISLGLYLVVCMFFFFLFFWSVCVCVCSVFHFSPIICSTVWADPYVQVHEGDSVISRCCRTEV